MMLVRNLRGGLVGLGVLAVTLTLIVAQYVALRLTGARAHAIPRLYHRIVLRLLDIRVDTDGRLAEGPVLIVANHASWIDIMVIGSLGRLAFVAKHEVRDWPLFGLLARLQRTVFVDRERRQATAAVNDEIAERLAAGERLVLFAEGTSSDGNRVLPFRSALFGAVGLDGARGPRRGVRVQPLSVAYTRVHGLPIGRQFRPNFAWYGDMGMPNHLWGVLCAGPVDVKVTLHEAFDPAAFADRKQLARHSEAVVRAGLHSALVGRAIAPGEALGPEALA